MPSGATDAILDRSLPHSDEAEACVLGAMMLDKWAAGVVAERLVPSDFHRTKHRAIFESLAELCDRNEGLDLVILKEHLERKGRIEEAGGAAYLAQIVGAVPSAANAEHYAKIVKEAAVRRGLIAAATETIRDAYDSPNEAGDILERAEQRMYTVGESQVGDNISDIKTVLVETFERLEDLSASGKGQVTGIDTGYYEINKYTSGFQRGELAILAARPSVGKTSLALNIARNVACGQGSLPVAIFSLETSRLQIAQNLLCMDAKVDSRKLRDGYANAEERTRLEMSRSKLSDAPIYIDDSPGISPMELRIRARRLAHRYDVQLIVLDYLQLMTTREQVERRDLEVAAISRSLKGLARELNIPVLALSQLRREVETREDKRPFLADLRESGALEQDADLVLMLYRDMSETSDEVEAKLIIAKNRNGPTASNLSLMFVRKFFRFENFSTRQD